MIYKKFDTIPYKLLVEIIETGNVKLLSDDENVTEEELTAIWEDIYNTYSENNNSDEEKRVLMLYREIYYFECKHRAVQLGCDILEFDYNQDVADEFEAVGYYINKDNFLENIDRIRRESQGLLIQADSFRESLPKYNEDNKITVDDILASYCVILEIDFDFNTVPASKVIALGKQIDKKIKSLTSKQN